MTAPGEDPRDQYERTLLAWRRTALSLVATGLLVVHLAARDVGRPAVAVTLAGMAAVVAFVWLGGESRTGAVGLVLVLGVVLLGVTTLVGVAAG